MSTNTPRTVIEKEIFILEADKKNKNHRTYPKALVQRWVEDSKLKTEGYDAEYGVDDVDFEYEFLADGRVCGNIFELRLDGNKLFAKVKFKIDGPYADAIYGIEGKEGNIDKLALVPKGKGAVKNQIIQDDYELYGFMVILAAESSFADEELVTAEASK
jgi:hypothetical protein